MTLWYEMSCILSKPGVETIIVCLYFADQVELLLCSPSGFWQHTIQFFLVLETHLCGTRSKARRKQKRITSHKMDPIGGKSKGLRFELIEMMHLSAMRTHERGFAETWIDRENETISQFFGCKNGGS